MMSPVVFRIDENNKAELSTTNGQLVTPALSPISEHGDRGTQPFPSYEAADEVLRPVSTTKDDPVVDTNYAEHDWDLGGGTRDNTRSESGSKPQSPSKATGDTGKTFVLSPKQIHDLTSSPGSLPIRAATPINEEIPPLSNAALDGQPMPGNQDSSSQALPIATSTEKRVQHAPDMPMVDKTPGAFSSARPGKGARSVSSPMIHRKQSSTKVPKGRPQVSPLKLEESSHQELNGSLRPSPRQESQASPMPLSIPVPPLSLPTYLQLELSSNRPSAPYIHRSETSDFPYESSQVKFERLLNFLLLPPQLEQVLWFGALACLDSWLYTFTILPLRFLKAVAILLQWWGQSAANEVHDLSTFVYGGLGRVWQRRRRSSVASSRRPSMTGAEQLRRPSVVDIKSESTSHLNGHIGLPAAKESARKRSGFRHRRTRSTPSLLLPNHKADILQGLLVVLSCAMLMWFDASRMYHSIRGQAAIKLYVIYNVLEVFDRLFSALGQDILECLFSKETLERNPNGRSKIFRPLWMFALALAYNVIHATALFYQVVTLNVAVNSYSNALLTLLMSNQFVEIKGTVFKKFEKENLFQLTCADVVERFQLWLMLLIIALRNIVEVGGLSISLGSAFSSAGSATESLGANATGLPVKSTTLIPKAFTLMPRWTGEVLGPFLIVLGSEMLVDWLKHAYITKFNNVKPNIYGRFLDVLAKDYYSHAFADQNLTKRLGLPVLPLSCLFIRASMQTYHMFLATHVPLPIPSSATSVSVESQSAATSPATTAALQHIDHIFRRALGRSSFGAGSEPNAGLSWWNLDDVIALATMAIFFLALYLVLLACKLVLGMLLLSFARSRYTGMKERERESVDARGRRIGGWGVVEVNEDKRRWIYEDDNDALRNLREKEADAKAKAEKGEVNLDKVDRYTMAAKRIW